MASVLLLSCRTAVAQDPGHPATPCLHALSIFEGGSGDVGGGGEGRGFASSSSINLLRDPVREISSRRAPK